MTETINRYLLAVCNPLSLEVADRIGLSQNGKGQLMDERREGSRKYMLIYVADSDGQILNYKLVDEEDARRAEGPDMKVIINH